MFERATFPGGGIGDDPIDFSPFVTFREVFGDRHSIFTDKEKTVAVLVRLHFIAGAYPASQLGFGLFVFIEVAGAQGLAEFLDVHRQALDHRFGDGWIGVHGGAALLSETFHELHDFIETLLLRFSHGNTPLVRGCN